LDSTSCYVTGGNDGTTFDVDPGFPVHGAYVAKFDNNLNFDTALSLIIETGIQSSGKAIVVDEANSMVYVAGEIDQSSTGPVNVRGYSSNPLNPSSVGGVFVSAIPSDLSGVLWTVVGGGTDPTYTTSLVLTSSKLFVLGGFQTSFTFGGVPLAPTSGFGQYQFLFSLNPTDGTLDQLAPEIPATQAYSLTSSTDDLVYLTGAYIGDVTAYFPPWPTSLVESAFVLALSTSDFSYASSQTFRSTSGLGHVVGTAVRVKSPTMGTYYLGGHLSQDVQNPAITPTGGPHTNPSVGFILGKKYNPLLSLSFAYIPFLPPLPFLLFSLF
jgi:hypothetical protein